MLNKLSSNTRIDQSAGKYKTRLTPHPTPLTREDATLVRATLAYANHEHPTRKLLSLLLKLEGNPRIIRCFQKAIEEIDRHWPVEREAAV